MKNSLIFIALASILFFSFRQNEVTNHDPDEDTACKIAEAVWLPIYGNAILKQKPYKAKLVNDYWVVEGTLDSSIDYGGVAYIEIRKSDCKIMKVSHGK